LKNILNSKEKISEKAFSQSLLISVLSILLCIVALCSVTYAWFTASTSSDSNTLISGSFDITVYVSRLNEQTSAVETVAVTPDPVKAGVYECALAQKGTYTISLKLNGGSTVKGHCVVKVGDDSPKHTDAIIGAQTQNQDNRELTDPFIFTINVEEPTTVTFEPRWGIVVEPDIKHKATYPMPQTTDILDYNAQEPSV
jgi:hypothetical protein